MGIFDLFKKKKDEFELVDTEINIDSESIEVFMNESENKCGELYFKNGCYTFKIIEKLSEDYEGRIHYYWCPAQATASFFDTKEKAIKEIMSIINE